MDASVADVLVLLLLLQTKHVIADFFLQNAYIIQNRRVYGHPAGLLHVAIHLLGSLAVLLVVGAAPQTLAALLIVEAVRPAVMSIEDVRLVRVPHGTCHQP